MGLLESVSVTGDNVFKTILVLTTIALIFALVVLAIAVFGDVFFRKK